MNEERMKRVGDVAGTTGELVGEQVKVSELVDSEFVVTSVRQGNGDYGPYLVVQIQLDGNDFFFFTSHVALVRKLELCVDDLPLLATIKSRIARRSGRQYFDIE